MRSLRRSGAILRLFSRLFGPYPFEQTGAIVDRAAKVGYALETQTRALYPGPPDDFLIAHELAHQWFGDSVTPSVWPDIWLNEGFATWAEWRWEQEVGGLDHQAEVRKADEDTGVRHQPLESASRRPRRAVRALRRLGL